DSVRKVESIGSIGFQRVPYFHGHGAQLGGNGGRALQRGGYDHLLKNIIQLYVFIKGEDHLPAFEVQGGVCRVDRNQHRGERIPGTAAGRHYIGAARKENGSEYYQPAYPAPKTLNHYLKLIATFIKLQTYCFRFSLATRRPPLLPPGRAALRAGGYPLQNCTRCSLPCRSRYRTPCSVSCARCSLSAG